MQLHGVFLAVDGVLRGAVEVELDTSGREVLILTFFVKKVDCVCPQEVFSEVKPDLVTGACPEVLLSLDQVGLIRVLVVTVLEADGLEVGVVGWVSEESDW